MVAIRLRILSNQPLPHIKTGTDLLLFQRVGVCFIIKSN